MNVYTIISMTY